MSESNSKIPNNYIKTGRLGRTYKTEGFLYFWTLNSKDNLVKAGELMACEPRTGKTLTLSIAEVLSPSNINDGLLIKFKSHESRELARNLSNYDIYISREYASNLKDGEVYVQDLVGLNLVVHKGDALEAIARVEDVREGAQSLLLFCTTLAPPFKTFYIPYMKIFVGEPNLDEGTIELIELGLLP